MRIYDARPRQFPGLIAIATPPVCCDHLEALRCARCFTNLPDHFYVAWQDETTFDWFNLYRGDLAVLVQSGVYTQDPGTAPLAGRTCGLTEPFMLDMPGLLPGQAVIYFLTGVSSGGAMRCILRR